MKSGSLNRKQQKNRCENNLLEQKKHLKQFLLGKLAFLQPNIMIILIYIVEERETTQHREYSFTLANLCIILKKCTSTCSL